MNEVSTERRNFLQYPTNRVVGTVGSAANARAAIDTLLGARFKRGDIEILHDEEDLRHLAPTGADHGLLAQFQWTWIRTFGSVEEFSYLTHYLEDIRAGRYVIMVLAKRRVQRILAADILNRYGAEFVAFYGRWAWEGLSAPPRTSPEVIPALFARAWNDRDADALASLFDEDADFVNVTGMHWNDRASIRKAHADGLDAVNASTLTPEATTVKPLSPDVAVVHARMTLSGQAATGRATPAPPRTTIASFVVHRIGDRWQCASVHHTDVIPNMEASAVDEAGVFRSASDQSGQAS